MKSISILRGGAALLIMALAATPVAAQSHHDSGHFRGGGRFEGSHLHGDRFHGRYWERHVWGGYPYAYDGFGLGIGLGAALAYPWPHDYGGDYYSYYNDYGAYDEANPPPYYGYEDEFAQDGEEDGDYTPPAAAQAQAPDQRRYPQVCGSWSWDAYAHRYDWIPC